MSECLILRFDAPMMSFGGVVVDQHNATDRFPGVSLVTGLLGNALGYEHRDAARLAALQARLIIAARWDIAPEPLLDYQTVDLGQPKMALPGWTSRGMTEHREGGSAAKGTLQRYRHFWANGVMTVAVALADNTDPDLEGIEAALQQPARPLFIGRKNCLPSSPLLVKRQRAESVLEALRQVPPVHRAGSRMDTASMSACWPADLDGGHPVQSMVVYDQRDWHNRWHSGQRKVVQGWLEVAHVSD